MWKQKALPFYITVFHLRPREFTCTQKYLKASGLYWWLSSRLHSEDSKPVRTRPLACTFRSRSSFRNFIFSFNDQRGAVELTTDARRSDNLKHTPAASRTILFSDQRSVLSFKPTVSVCVFCFPFPRTLSSSQVVTREIISGDTKRDSS